MNQPLLDQLLHSPDAYLLIEQATATLHRENERRAAFYDEITEQEKVEFINGEVVVHSPVMKRHNVVSGLLYRLLSVYADRNHLGFVGIEKIMIRLTRNDYEPDLVFFRAERAAGFAPEQTLFPAPDLVVEILSNGTEHRDRGVKQTDYAAHGIGEYWIVDAEQRSVEQYLLRTGRYELAVKSGTGLLRSEVVTAFEVPIPALFDEAENLRALGQLLA